VGLYYVGGLDWTFTERPIRTMTDLTASQALGPAYARYAEAQWRELIANYELSIAWNDMGWPAESTRTRSSPTTTRQSRTASSTTAGGASSCREAARPSRDPTTHRSRAEAHGADRQSTSPAGTVFHYDIETHEYESPPAAIEDPWEVPVVSATRSDTAPRRPRPRR
jgi:alpha-L-fucosidase